MLRLGGALLAFALAAPAFAGTPHEIGVKVIRASKRGKAVDPKLEELSKQLAALPFSSFALADQAKFELELGTSGRMQLPGGEWMTIEPTEIIAAKGKLRIIIAVAKLELKATVAAAAGATVVVPGPAVAGGQLLLAVTRVKL